MDDARETPMPGEDPGMNDDLLTEDAILNEHDMTEPLSMDGGKSLSAENSLSSDQANRPADDGGDGGDQITNAMEQPEGGYPPSVRGSMVSLRGERPEPESTPEEPAITGSRVSVRDDPAAGGDAPSVRGSMVSLRGEQTELDSTPEEPVITGSRVSLRDDPAAGGDAPSVRGSMASLRGEREQAAPASVRGSTVSLRGGAGVDRPPTSLNRPPTSRPPLSAAATRPADSTVRANKMNLKNKRNSEELQKSPLKEEAEEEFQGDNIWAIAEKMNQARILRGLELNENQSVETTLLFVGGKQSGKSRLLHKFLDRDEEPKKTLGLEYSYGRKAGKSVLKDVCHIWELGGGTTYTPLLETPLKAERLPTLSVLLVIDLTKPQNMWTTIETMIKTLRDVLDSEISSGIGRQMQLQERLKKATELRVPPDHPDSAHLKPFPVPLVLVGGHYDVFQDWDPEKKKLICRSLRYLAHINGASLYFFSSHDSALVKKAKDMMNQLAFGGPASGYLAQDYNKPLLIPAGTDSLAGILGVGADTSYNASRNAFAAQYPQDAQGAAALPDDPAKDMSYREAEIDQLRSQKDQELERLRRELERRRRWGDEL